MQLVAAAVALALSQPRHCVALKRDNAISHAAVLSAPLNTPGDIADQEQTVALEKMGMIKDSHENISFIFRPLDKIAKPPHVTSVCVRALAENSSSSRKPLRHLIGMLNPFHHSSQNVPIP